MSMRTCALIPAAVGSVPDAPLAQRTSLEDVGAVSYADSTTPEPIDRELYEREISLSPIYGRRLAWTGIVLSAISLVIAIAYYTHR